MLKNAKTNRGFTLVELLIVIVVIAILAAISIVAYNGIQNRAKTSSGQSLASQVAKKAEAYNTARTSGSGYPTPAELKATTSAVPEAQLDNPNAVFAYTASGDLTNESNFDGGNAVVYRQLSATGACVYYWDYTVSSNNAKSIRVGTGSC